MTEAQIGLLLKAASVLNQNNNTQVNKILESYYLLRCKQITKGFGLPKQKFSEEIRCLYCCREWNHIEPKLKSMVLSKRQKKRIRSRPKHKESNNKKYLLHSNKLVKTCSLCSKSVTQILPKPKQSLTKKQVIKGANTIENSNDTRTIENTESEKTIIKRGHKKKKEKNKRLQSTVYCDTKVAFSINEKKNTIPSTIKEPPKIIKNNKKKKDKLAGLCSKAVSAAAKFKQQKENKLNLFLKPST